MNELKEATNVLAASAEIKSSLHCYTNDCHRLEFVEDANGNWFVGKQCCDDPAFAEIRNELMKMTEIPLAVKLESVVLVDEVTLEKTK